MNKDKRNNIQLLGTLNNADESGIIANASQIYDANEDKSTQDVSKEHTERIKTLEDKENELIAAVGTGGSVDTRITNAINVEQTRAVNAENALDGKITAEQTRATNTENALDDRLDTLEEAVGTGGSVDSRIASAVATETSRAQSAESTLQTNINAEATRAQIAESNLQELYRGLTQSNIEVVSALPETGEAYKIYRLIGINSYADYMYNSSDLTTPIKMAEYDNAIDDEPTAGSNNLVKSGGVAKIYGKYINNPKFVRVYTDADGKIVWAIKTDGSVYYGAGVPQQVKDYIDKHKTDGDNAIADIYKKSNPNDEEGNVIDTNSIKSVINNPEYLKAFVDNTNKLIEAIGLDGVRKFFAGINIQDVTQCVIDNPDYTIALVDNENRIIFAIQHDGNPYFGYGVPKQITDEIKRLFGQYATANAIEIETNDDNISAYIGKNGNIDADIDDNTGDLNLYFDPENIDIKNGYELDNGDLVVETNKVITL